MKAIMKAKPPMSSALEKRILNPLPLKSAPLPVDWLRMAKEVFTNHFEALLKECAEKCNSKFGDDLLARATFEIQGAIYADEILLSISLHEPSRVAATTVHTSCEFDPKASAPNAQDILGACVDAASEMFTSILDPNSSIERLNSLLNDSLGSLIEHSELKKAEAAEPENKSEKKLTALPIEWTLYEVNRMKIYLRVDKANLVLDQQAEDWLEKNDPDYESRKMSEQKETEKLFVTGPKGSKNKGEIDLADSDSDEDDSDDDSSNGSKTFH